MPQDFQWTRDTAQQFKDWLCAACAQRAHTDIRYPFSLTVTKDFAAWLHMPINTVRRWLAHDELPVFADYMCLTKLHPELELPQYEDPSFAYIPPYDRIKAAVLALIDSIACQVDPQDLAAELRKAVTEDALKEAIENALIGVASGPRG